MQISIIIVNYNVKYFLEQCLISVTHAARGLQAEIFVVDNNSADGSKEFFADKFSQVKFIWNQENFGFAKANNIAVRQASGKYILFLNPDTIVPEDCFTKCISFLDSHPDAGALGIKMLDGSGKFLKESKRAFPSPLTSLYKLFGLSRLFPHSKSFSRYHLGHLEENKTNEADVLAGAFMMVPKRIIDTIGSFDEDFFMYGEDIDLSFRIQDAGYKNYYFAGSNIIHFKGESTRKGHLNYVRLFYKAMSIFARKHYSGGKAGLFNFLLQIAIFLRAVISVLARAIRWVGMPVIDAATIFMSFWLVKLAWNYYIRKDVNYSPYLLLVAFPVFTLIFLAASYYSGLYDNGFRQRRLNHAVAIAFVILLSFYSLLPETVRFSRGILVIGSVVAFFLMTVVRWVLVQWKIIERVDEDEEHRRTIVAGTRDDFESVMKLMRNSGMGERILGRIDVDQPVDSSAIGEIEQISDTVNKYSVREIIYCEGKLSFQRIIEMINSKPRSVRAKIYAGGSESIIGSNDKNFTGGYVSSDKRFNLTEPVNKRNKNLTAVLMSIFFIISFPFHLFLQKKPGTFFKNVFSVLFLKKTWVAYASSDNELPGLKPGVLTSTGLPAVLNKLPEQSLKASDEWYAADYSIWKDIEFVGRGYRYLSI